MNNKLVSLGLILALVGVGTNVGCSAFQPKTQAVTIEASDPTAEILVDGASVGRGKVATQLARNKDHTITATAAGGQKGVTTLGRKVSGTGVLDIIGGCFFLVPFIGVFTPGFWDLNSDRVELLVK